ncbi:P pilus assembly chaperone PapD [Enterobacillus tribolii]|uniref:P pilus assembly chaperone PapD n=2 Tax=Enterobacillus tribolii TaxID=1487935 RepID=A0A370QEF1_9GAMM|nr:P pilus assembly chaperone PapD [Enterobacillus tribolii]
MNVMNIWLKVLLLSLCVPLAQAADAGGITVGGTRLIYDGGKKEASLSVTNSDTGPYLIQSWIETQNGGAEKAPFIITPPLFRLEAGQKNLLRVIRTGGNLPEDRESLYWINIKSVPSGEKRENVNTLQIAVKTRIKLIFRPAGLKSTPLDVADKLTWSQTGNRLTVNNPTPFYMNFHQINVGKHQLNDATFVAPMGSTSFTVPSGVTGAVTWKIITDYGGVSETYLNKQ